MLSNIVLYYMVLCFIITNHTVTHCIKYTSLYHIHDITLYYNTDLMLLKQAMRTVSDRMARESRDAPQQTSSDDCVGHTMRFIRAAERGCVGVMRRFISLFPRLGTLVALPLSLAGQRGAALQPYRRLVVELARASAIDSLAELNAAQADLPAEELSSRRSRIHRVLQRLSPGRSSGLAAVVDQHGEVLTDPVEMASALREHWRGVFARRPVDTQLLNAWLEEDSPPAAPPPDGAAWQLGAHHVQAAIERSPDSAPGPDGIPFKAWRQLGPLGVDVLGAALQALTAPDAPEDLQAFLADFNGSLMVFLPKGDGLLPDGRTGHAPSDTRPLNIVNSDNRLLAAAVRFCVEEPLSTMITVDQQGFVPGRSMLSNVVDIDEIMMLTALSQPRGAAWFFDFQAAFPSVAHDFLMAALRAAGLPGWLTQFVEYLYEHNNCQMVVGGSLHVSFSSHAGIRKGCPLSPILFAVAVDVLLRRLRAKVPGVELRRRGCCGIRPDSLCSQSARCLPRVREAIWSTPQLAQDSRGAALPGRSRRNCAGGDHGPARMGRASGGRSRQVPRICARPRSRLQGVLQGAVEVFG